MRVGDSVKWHANATDHYGRIVAIVPARWCIPDLRMHQLKGSSINGPKLGKMLAKGTGRTARDYDSPICECAETHEYYFPRLSGLEVV